MIASRAAVATPHVEATLAARDILQANGNAFDAAVAAMLTLCVVHSHQVGIGGYGGNLVAYLAPSSTTPNSPGRKTGVSHDHQDRSAPSGKVISIDFDSRAPYAFRPDLFTDPNDRTLGYKSISVPAIPAGLDLTLKTYGTKSWSDVTARAIKHADEGFPTDEASARFLKAWANKTDPESRKHFFKNGVITDFGQPWIQPDLANLLRNFAADGIAPFYTGDIARHIINHVHAHGGILTERDFAEYRPQLVSPISITYRNHEIYMPPPPGGGITTLQILKTLEHFDLSTIEPWSAGYFHLFAHATKLCWTDRERALGDPDFVDIPIDDLLSDENTRAKADQIRRTTTQPAATQPRDRMNHTANVTILDHAGNLVSMTATQGMVFGSQVVIPQTGLIMNHGMSRFDYSPASHPNYPHPGKRMHHNMSPTIVLQDHKPNFACGLPGGTKIITVTAQLLINFIDFKTVPHDCISSPRIHTEEDQPIAVSSKVSDAVVEKLEQFGHKVHRGQSMGGPPTEIAGHANALAIDPATRHPTAASQASPDAAIVI